MPDELVSIAISPAAFRASQRAGAAEFDATDFDGDSSFLTGPENRLAATAVQSLLEPAASPYNPLVVCGVPGSGKSHLARGVAARWNASGDAGDANAVCLTAADFARELAEAIELETVGELRARWSSAALFVLEDLVQLATKPAAQAELVVLLDLFARQETQVIITARMSPSKIPGLSPPLVSRLSAGLLVPLVLPGTAARCALIERFAGGRGIVIEPSAARQLAEGLSGNVPELYGAVLELSMLARETEGDSETTNTIDSPRVRRYLLERGNRLRPTLTQIVRATARFFGLKSADLKSSSRRRAVVTARGVVIYLARQLTGQGLQQLGAQLGGRDRSTVLHSFRQTEQRLRTDPEMQRAVGEIQIVLAGG